MECQRGSAGISGTHGKPQPGRLMDEVRLCLRVTRQFAHRAGLRRLDTSVHLGERHATPERHERARGLQ